MSGGCGSLGDSAALEGADGVLADDPSESMIAVGGSAGVCESSVEGGFCNAAMAALISGGQMVVLA